MKKLLLALGIVACMVAAEPGPNAQDQAPKKPAVKHTTPPPIHSAKGVIASPWSPEHVKHPRGLTKTPRFKLISAHRFDPVGIKIPAQITMLPKQLSMWGNDQYGDCVSASEAARIAGYSVFCGLPETFIPEATLIAWASRGGYLDGANLTDVMTDRQTRGMADANGKLYVAGPYASVDYTNESTLQAALATGPVNVGMDANALPSGAGNNQGWYASGGSPGQYSNEDHCCALLGFGKSTDLAAAIGQAYNVTVTLPANFPATGYLYFTWSTIGIVDHAWLMSTVGEAWVQNPTTVGQTPGPIPVPPIPPVPVPPVPVPPGPVPPPGPVTTITTNNALPAGTYEVSPVGTAAAIAQAKAALAMVGTTKAEPPLLKPKQETVAPPKQLTDPRLDDFIKEQRDINDKVYKLLQRVVPKEKASIELPQTPTVVATSTYHVVDWKAYRSLQDVPINDRMQWWRDNYPQLTSK